MGSSPTYRTGDNTATAVEFVPSAWLRFLYRVAGLKRGHIYTVTLVIPEDENADPVFAIQSVGKIENGKRVAT